MLKDLFRILVIANVNVINHVIGEYLDYENCKCRKKLVNKLVEMCTENIHEVKILARCTLCCFQYLYNHHRNYYLFCLLQIHEL